MMTRTEKILRTKLAVALRENRNLKQRLREAEDLTYEDDPENDNKAERIARYAELVKKIFPGVNNKAASIIGKWYEIEDEVSGEGFDPSVVSRRDIVELLDACDSVKTHNFVVRALAKVDDFFDEDDLWEEEEEPKKFLNSTFYTSVMKDIHEDAPLTVDHNGRKSVYDPMGYICFYTRKCLDPENQESFEKFMVMAPELEEYLTKKGITNFDDLKIREDFAMNSIHHQGNSNNDAELIRTYKAELAKIGQN